MNCELPSCSCNLVVVAFARASYPAISTTPGQAQPDPLAGVVP
jgi:hypothetical protein